MRNNSFHFITVFILLVSLLTVAQGQGPLDQLDSLIALSEYEAAINKALHLEDALLPAQKDVEWDTHFKRWIKKVVHGPNEMFCLLQMWGTDEHDPEWAAVLPAISVNHSVSDWSFALVSLDLETGDMNWMRFVNGLVDFEYNHQNDRLYLFREKLIRIDPKTGEVDQEYDLEKGVDGLVLGPDMAFSTRRGKIDIDPDTELLLHDPIKEVTDSVDVGAHYYTSPSGEHQITLSDTGLTFAQKPGTHKRKSLIRYKVEHGPPLWINDSPFFVTQPRKAADAIVSINPVYGNLMWKYAFPWGAHRSSTHQRSNGSYMEEWMPIRKWEGGMLALDDGDHLHFLPIYSKPSDVSVKLTDMYVSMPFQRGNQLIVSSTKWVRSYSISSLMVPDSSFHAGIRIRRATCLHEMGELESAKDLLEQVVQDVPSSADAWELLAAVNGSLGDDAESWYSYHKYLSLAGITSNDEMYEQWGLLRQLDLKGKPAWVTAEIDGHIYAGNIAGDLWALRVEDMYFDRVARMDRKMAHLYITKELDAFPGRRAPYERSRFPKADFEKPSTGPEWQLQGGIDQISAVIPYRGRPYRTVVNGGTRELVDGTVVDHPSLLGDIGSWKVHMTDLGPLGYGRDIYALDEHLRPKEVLIHINVEGAEPSSVKIEYIVTIPGSVGLVISSSKGALMQVYSMNGLLVNQVDLGRYLSGRSGSEPLIGLGNGFLFCDRQMHWLSADGTRGKWKYGPALERTEGLRPNDRWRYFGAPLLVNGCIFLTAADGHLLAFDTKKMTER